MGWVAQQQLVCRWCELVEWALGVQGAQVGAGGGGATNINLTCLPMNTFTPHFDSAPPPTFRPEVYRRDRPLVGHVVGRWRGRQAQSVLCAACGGVAQFALCAATIRAPLPGIRICSACARPHLRSYPFGEHTEVIVCMVPARYADVLGIMRGPGVYRQTMLQLFLKHVLAEI